MTHSGQGDDRRPAARPAHEGVVLPSDGSAPWVPPGARPPGQDPDALPAAGQQPGQRPGQLPPGDAEAADDWWDRPAGAHSAGQPYPPGPGAPGTLPPAGPVPGYGGGSGDVHGGFADGYGDVHGGFGGPGRGDAPGVRSQPLPPAQPTHTPGPFGTGRHRTDPYGAGPRAAGPYAPGPPSGGRHAAGRHAADPHTASPHMPSPYAADPHGADPYGGAAAQNPYASGPGPLGAADATQVIPPVPAAGSGSGFGSGDATQVIPPVGAGPLPPQMPAGAADATQVIPPVGAGPLPPESPAGAPGGHHQDAATRVMPPIPAGPAAPAGPSGPRRTPPPPTGAPYGIRPGAPADTPQPGAASPDDRRTPAEFDNLFRTAGQGPRPGGPQPPAPAPVPAPAPGGRGSRRRAQPPKRRRTGRTVGVPVIAAVVVGCAVLGLGVSALLFSGDEDGGKDPARDDRPAASPAAPGQGTAPGAAPSAPPAEDLVQTQARALDGLLADSNDSRAAVIRSVENIKRCTELSVAATDLRAAAEQRRSLVTRLNGLSLDRLPEHEDLTEALTEAWEASAEADDHYAAWAEQVAGRKGCKKGKARTTGRTARGNSASGEATEAKQEAAQLWKPTASRYGLPPRTADQL
ncbi:hypothetical protein [Streptomyces yaizuensis]|uniref:Uncharacterized protein n=1 Tax=Streptomyces yaizuensis TaxID=2989713 RepID=A0ABQ5P3X4_9ACTN|nr:hypothetical protein [Streptomyces sp. YSPA8]GLF97289.1 hypothetical protein SYYSPA8_23350 [Streptomyces sp. YSPA8]